MKIASIAKSNTEILHSLGCRDEIIASTTYDRTLAPNAEVIGSYTDINIERLIKLKPDIVFSSTFLQEKYAKELSQRGINVVHFDPLSVEDILQNILDAGTAVNKWENAGKIVLGMKKSIQGVKSKVSGMKKVKVYSEEWPNPPMAAGNWVVEMLGIAGAKGITGQGERSREVTLAEVFEFNPEKIILNWCGVGLNAKPEIVLQRSGWKVLNAVKNNKIFVVDDSYFNTPGPNVVKGIELIEKIVNEKEK